MLRRALSLTLVLILGGACSSARLVSQRPPTRLELIEAAVAAERGRHIFLARYNPPLCPCPPFELRFDGRWIRVALVERDPEAPVVPAVRGAAQRASGSEGGPPLYVIGTPDTATVTRCATGFPVIEFRIEGFTNQPPAPDEDR